MINSLPDYFLEKTSSIICHASDFSSTMSLNRKFPLYRRDQFLPNISNLRRAEYYLWAIRPSGRSICIFPSCTFANRQEKRNGEGGSYSDIFHFVSNRGIAIREVTLAASSGKQVVATVLLLEHETGERHTGKCRMAWESPRRVTLIECKCCGKPKLLIRFGTA